MIAPWSEIVMIGEDLRGFANVRCAHILASLARTAFAANLSYKQGSRTQHSKLVNVNC